MRKRQGPFGLRARGYTQHSAGTQFLQDTMSTKTCTGSWFSSSTASQPGVQLRMDFGTLRATLRELHGTARHALARRFPTLRPTPVNHSFSSFSTLFSVFQEGVELGYYPGVFDNADNIDVSGLSDQEVVSDHKLIVFLFSDVVIFFIARCKSSRAYAVAALLPNAPSFSQVLATSHHVSQVASEKKAFLVTAKEHGNLANLLRNAAQTLRLGRGDISSIAVAAEDPNAVQMRPSVVSAWAQAVLPPGALRQAQKSPAPAARGNRGRDRDDDTGARGQGGRDDGREREREHGRPQAAPAAQTAPAAAAVTPPPAAPSAAPAVEPAAPVAEQAMPAAASTPAGPQRTKKEVRDVIYRDLKKALESYFQERRIASKEAFKALFKVQLNQCYDESGTLSDGELRCLAVRKVDVFFKTCKVYDGK